MQKESFLRSMRLWKTEGTGLGNQAKLGGNIKRKAKKEYKKKSHYPQPVFFLQKKNAKQKEGAAQYPV